MFNLILFT